MEMLTLEPLSQAEIEGSAHNLVDALFGAAPWVPRTVRTDRADVVRRYLALHEALFILQPLPAWSANLGKRLVKSPKLHLIDAGLTAHLQGHGDPAPLALSAHLGPLLETFVVQELRRHLRWAETAATAWHFRTAAGREVDMVPEASGQRVAGIEVKASASIARADFAGLRELAGAAGKGFTRGIVLYTGEQLLPFEDHLWAVPIGVLWAA